MTYLRPQTGVPSNGMTYWELKKISPKKRITLFRPQT